MPVPGAARPVVGEDIRLVTQNYLLFKEPTLFEPVPGWIRLGQAISDTLGGDAAGFALPAPQAPTDVQSAAVACLDNPAEVTTYRDLRRLMRQAREVAPHLQGASESWTLLRCLGYPIPGTNPPRRLDIRDVPPILLVELHRATPRPPTSGRCRCVLRSGAACC